MWLPACNIAFWHWGANPCMYWYCWLNLPGGKLICKPGVLTHAVSMASSESGNGKKKYRAEFFIIVLNDRLQYLFPWAVSVSKINFRVIGLGKKKTPNHYKAADSNRWLCGGNKYWRKMFCSFFFFSPFFFPLLLFTSSCQLFQFSYFKPNRILMLFQPVSFHLAEFPDSFWLLRVSWKHPSICFFMGSMISRLLLPTRSGRN